MKENQLKLSDADKANFLETAKWGKFLAIVGFVFSGFMILVGLTMMGGMFKDIPMQMGAFGFIYIILSLIYVFPALYMYRFSTRIHQGIRSGDSHLCSDAYVNLKKFFLFVGILTIVVLAFYVLAILFAIMGGVMGGML